MPTITRQIQVTDRVTIPHPNPKSTVSIILTDFGFFHVSKSGSITLRTAELAEYLAEWFPAKELGLMQGQTNSPEAFVRTGIRNIVTFNVPGQFDYITLSNLGITLITPNPSAEGPLYLESKLSKAEFVNFLKLWYR